MFILQRLLGMLLPVIKKNKTEVTLNTKMEVCNLTLYCLMFVWCFGKHLCMYVCFCAGHT